VQLLGNGYQADAESGTYQLRIVSADGKTTYRSFTPASLDHLDEKHISVLLPAIPGIVSIDVMKDGKIMPKAAPPKVVSTQAGVASISSASMKKSSALVADTATIEQSGNNLHLVWDNNHYPWLTAIFIGNDGSHTTLAMRATGGNINLNLAKLTQAGRVQISLSDGLNTIMKTQAINTTSH